MGGGPTKWMVYVSGLMNPWFINRGATKVGFISLETCQILSLETGQSVKFPLRIEIAWKPTRFFLPLNPVKFPLETSQIALEIRHIPPTKPSDFS